MTSNPVRVAVVGLDHWYTAVPLAEALARHPEAELVGLSDPDEGRAREIATRSGCDRVTTNRDELVTDPAVDVVAAFGSVDSNPDTCVRAAEHGKHIVSVKPLANTLGEATRIRAAVRRAGVGFLPSETRARTTPHNQQLRRWATEGRFGRPMMATFQMWGGLPKGWPTGTGSGWFTDPERAPGGGWIDHAIYHIDLLRWLFDTEVRDVSGRVANLQHTDLALEDYGHAQIEFDNGMQATVEDTWVSAPGGSRQTMSIVGSEGAVAHDTLSGRLSVLGSMHPFDGWTHLSSGGGYPAGIDDIIAFARGDRKDAGTVEDAWRNLAACRAFYDAAATGTTRSPEPLPDA